MTFSPTKQKITVDYLITTIDLYAKNPDWFIDESMRLRSPDSKEKKLSDEKILFAFFECFKKNPKTLTTIDVKKWEKIKATLTQFITVSKINESEKKSYLSSTTDFIQRCTESLTHDHVGNAKRLVQDSKEAKTLAVNAVRMLEGITMRLTTERISFNYMMFILLAEWHKCIAGEIFEQQGGAVRLTDDRFYSIDWEKCSKQTAEDFTVSARLEEAYNEGKGDYYPVLKKLISSSQPVTPFIEIWRSLHCIFQIDYISSYFVNALAHLQGPIANSALDPSTIFFSKEIKELHVAIIAMAQNPLYRNTIQLSKKKIVFKEYFEKHLLIATKYLSQTESINDFYKSLHTAIEEQKLRHKGYAPNAVPNLIGNKLPTPEEFVALSLPPISLDAFEKTIQSDFSRYSNALTTEDEAFTAITFMQYIYEKKADDLFPIESLHRFCKHYGINRTFGKKRQLTPEQKQTDEIPQKLIQEMSCLSITKRKTAAVTKKKPLKKSGSKPSPSRPQILPTPPLEKPQRVQSIRHLSLQKGTLLVAARVHDWHHNEPTALAHPPYNVLSIDKKIEAKLFHSYPFLVTQMLLNHAKPDCYQSPTTQKLNMLYSRPGTIHCYETEEAPFQGYFADCFDGLELYHHFFHQRKFSDLMARYATHSALVDSGEHRDIADEAQRLEKIVIGDAPVVAIGSLDERYLLKKKLYSIEVDDTALKIRYTLCFPEWVSS